MIIENSFDVDADPDRVFEFLQNPHNVATCFPGAELTEDLGDDQYKGKVKIKLGPVTAAFAGIARITEKDEAARIAVLVAEGKDARGSGTAKATATMRVEPKEGGGSSVMLKTDLTISGKLAQFGRGIMADVSGRMVGDLAKRVQERIESEPGASATEGAEAEATAAEAAATASDSAETPASTEAPVSTEAAASAEAGTAAGTEATTAAGAEKKSAATMAGTGTDSGAVSGATADTATSTAPAATATAPAKAAATAKAPTRPAAAPSEEPGAIKASTLLKVMIVGMFRRLFARLRGRKADTRNS